MSNLLPRVGSEEWKSRVDETLLFLEERAKFYFKNQYDISLINAVLDLRDLVGSERKLKALKEFLATDEGKSLLSGYKRANNILKDSQPSGLIDPNSFTADEESKLHGVVQDLTAKLDNAVGTKDFNKALELLTNLAQPIAAFFDNVMIKDKDPMISNNRLLILRGVTELFDKIAKFDSL